MDLYPINFVSFINTFFQVFAPVLGLLVSAGVSFAFIRVCVHWADRGIK